MAQDPQLFVDRFQLLAISRRHPLGGKPRAQRFQLRHRLEHFGQTVERRLRHDSAAMGAGFDQATGYQLAQRFTHRRARHGKAPRNVGLVERRPRRQHAAHDLVGKLQPQLFRARDLVPQRRSTVHAPDRRVGLGAGRRRSRGEIVKTHAFGSSGSGMMLTWAATTFQPSGKRTQVCIWRPTLPGKLSR